MGILSFFQRNRANNPGVYSIINMVTGTEYIGATTQPIKARWKNHRGELISNRHRNKWLQVDWNRYGEQAFIFVVIEVVKDQDAVFVREQYWQDRGYDRAKRYNPPNRPTEKQRLYHHVDISRLLEETRERAAAEVLGTLLGAGAMKPKMRSKAMVVLFGPAGRKHVRVKPWVDAAEAAAAAIYHYNPELIDEVPDDDAPPENMRLVPVNPGRPDEHSIVI